MAATSIAFVLVDKSGNDYITLLDKLVEKSAKPGELPNRSEYIRKLILREAKKARLLH